MPVGDPLGIGLSGTLSTQREIATTSHNIANANNDGYSRQRVLKTTRNPQHLANGALGQGVRISSVRRVHNEFLTTNVRDNTALSHSFNIGMQLTSQVDELLSDRKAGIGIVLQEFFDAVNSVANEPDSTTARQVMITQANTLTNRFHDIDSRLQGLKLATNKQTSNIVREINFLSKSIANLNERITLSQQSTGQPANDLLDKRDEYLRVLAEKIYVTTKMQDDGAVNVFIGNGQTLVLGITPAKLDVRVNEFDSSKVDIVFVGTGSESNVTRFISGGDLGGVLEFQQDIINGAKNELGRIALALATTFNEQHKSGLDVNSNFGKEFFSGLNDSFPEVISGASNNGDYQISAQVKDITKITASDYRLDYTGQEFILIRLNDNKLIQSFKNFPQEITSEGFSLNLDLGSNIEVSDSFLIRPGHLAAKNIKVLISETTDIAAASPIRAMGSISNLGNARINLEFVDVNDVQGEQQETVETNDDGTVKISVAGDRASSKISFNIDDIDDEKNTSDIGQSQKSNNSIAQKTKIKGNTKVTINILENNKLQIVSSLDGKIEKILSPEIRYKDNEDLYLSPIINGKQLSVTAKINGELVAGDSFTIEFNDDAVGDNGNILSLAKLHRANNLIEGRANFNQSYAELVSRVGTRNHELQVNAEAQQILLNQSILSKETVSGVNLDEEAANLIRLQTQFKANAKVIDSANIMFQELMSVFRR